MPIELIDIGVNLAHDSFDPDRAQVIERALAAGVTHFLVTGATLEGSRSAIALARERPDIIRATAGVHPHQAVELGETQLPQLRELMQAPEVCAAGECGLDYYRDFSPRTEQRRAFAWQLELAVEVRKPVFLHQRDAHADFVALLRDLRPRLTGGVAHCFTGGIAQLEDYLALDLYIGVTGWVCDERRGAQLREAVSRIPAERLLLETDAPYLAPEPYRGERCEPAYVRDTAEAIAAARGATLESFAEDTTAAAESFFRFS